MKTYLILILLIFQFGLGQKTPEPFHAVKTFFEAFHNRDLQGLKDSFDATAVMQRAAMRNGKSVCSTLIFSCSYFNFSFLQVTL